MHNSIINASQHHTLKKFLNISYIYYTICHHNIYYTTNLYHLNWIYCQYCRVNQLISSYKTTIIINRVKWFEAFYDTILSMSCFKIILSLFTRLKYLRLKYVLLHTQFFKHKYVIYVTYHYLFKHTILFIL